MKTQHTLDPRGHLYKKSRNLKRWESNIWKLDNPFHKTLNIMTWRNHKNQWGWSSRRTPLRGNQHGNVSSYEKMKSMPLQKEYIEREWGKIPTVSICLYRVTSLTKNLPPMKSLHKIKNGRMLWLRNIIWSLLGVKIPRLIPICFDVFYYLKYT